MSWAVGYDTSWHRDIGYGVPALCDRPGCETKIDRGFGHVCGGEPYGGENGCGLFFCAEHGGGLGYCTHRALIAAPDFAPSPDTSVWNDHKLTDPSWQTWREEHPVEVERLRAAA